jgi:hypothetical protein
LLKTQSDQLKCAGVAWVFLPRMHETNIPIVAIDVNDAKKLKCALL